MKTVEGSFINDGMCVCTSGYDENIKAFSTRSLLLRGLGALDIFYIAFNCRFSLIGAKDGCHQLYIPLNIEFLTWNRNFLSQHLYINSKEDLGYLCSCYLLTPTELLGAS